MRHPSSSRLSYRNVLIAAGLAAALGVGAAQSKPASADAAQPHPDGLTPDSAVDGNAAVPPARAHILLQRSGP